MSIALNVDKVGYAYSRNKLALDDISFEVRSGCFTALLGPNGAGKTTLMALITRLFQSRGGSISICGHDLNKQSRLALASMGVVFQRPTLDLDLTVQQNLRYSAKLYGLGRMRQEARILANLEALGMVELCKSPIRTLSGGMRRRVELIRALLHEPKLLVLDEPTVGLDIESRHSIVGHVHDLCRDRGLAVLWTTHLIDEVRAEDFVVMINGGKVRRQGQVAQVIERAAVADLSTAYARICGQALETDRL